MGMTNATTKYRFRDRIQPLRPYAWALGVALTTACSGGSSSPAVGATSNPSSNPFQSVERAANEPSAFTQPRAGVPLKDGSIAFLATVETLSEAETRNAGERSAVFITPPGGGAPRILYSGDALVNPLDIDVSFDSETLYIADPSAGAEGAGAILALSRAGGEPTELSNGLSPRSVAVAAEGKFYFSGIAPETGESGVFVWEGGSASAVHVGAPLVDASGLAIMKDGGILVADTRLFDGRTLGSTEVLSNEAGIVLLKDGTAQILATGFATGYPAGIALTRDEQSLIVSAQGPDRADVVHVFDMNHATALPLTVKDEFSQFQDSAGGLKRAHDSNTFIWASLSANGGTVYRIQGN
jgi:DNA-binding beta-propeller fold protein YncE